MTTKEKNDILEDFLKQNNIEDVEIEEMDTEEENETSNVEVQEGVKSEVEKSKEERALDFLKSIVEAENCIKPFKEHIADIKKSYRENLWLDKAEQSALIRALRDAQKKPFTPEQLEDARNIVKKINID